MKRKELIERLAQLAVQDAQQGKKREQQVPPGSWPPRPGDLVVLATGAQVIHWLLVKTHPDAHHLLFAVPVDDNPAAGPADMVLAESHPDSPLTLRCGAGLWIEADLIDPPVRVGTLGEDVLKPVRAMLGRLAAGTLKPSDEQIAVAADSDYLEWMDEVDGAREKTGAWLAEQGLVRSTAQLESKCPSPLDRFVTWIFGPSAAPAPMAAHGSGVRGQIMRRLAEVQTPRWLALDGLDGLYLAADPAGVRAVWTRSLAKPPRVQGQDGETFRPSKWTHYDAIATSEVWPWIDNRVVLRVGPRAGRKVVIRR